MIYVRIEFSWDRSLGEEDEVVLRVTLMQGRRRRRRRERERELHAGYVRHFYSLDRTGNEATSKPGQTGDRSTSVL